MRVHGPRHRGTVTLVSILALAGIAATGSGCPLRDLLRPRTPTPIPTPVPASGPVQITALPVYRLVVSDVLADVPSRLIAVYVRVYAKDDTQVNVSANDISLTLLSGEPGRVFDDPRAVELLHRTTLGDADLSYLQQYSHTPGGLGEYTHSELTATVLSRLFSDTVLSSSNSPVEGYVIVDTVQPVASLAGASMAITARRVDDGAPLQATYQIVPPQARSPIPETAASQPAPTAEPTLANSPPAAQPEPALEPTPVYSPAASQPEPTSEPAPANSPAAPEPTVEPTPASAPVS